MVKEPPAAIVNVAPEFIVISFARAFVPLAIMGCVPVLGMKTSSVAVGNIFPLQLVAVPQSEEPPVQPFPVVVKFPAVP